MILWVFVEHLTDERYNCMSGTPVTISVFVSQASCRASCRARFLASVWRRSVLKVFTLDFSFKEGTPSVGHIFENNPYVSFTVKWSPIDFNLCMIVSCNISG